MPELKREDIKKLLAEEHKEIKEEIIREIRHETLETSKEQRLNWGIVISLSILFGVMLISVMLFIVTGASAQ